MRKDAPTPTDAEILAFDNVPVGVAAKYIGSSTTSIYDALQDERAPYGYASKGRKGEGSFTYNISPGGLVKYKREGRPMISLKDLQELMADSAKEVLDAKMQSLDRVMRAVMDA